MTNDQKNAEAVIAMQEKIDKLEAELDKAKKFHKNYEERSRGYVRTIEAELDKHRWIPVEEGLPEKGGLYYTFARYTSMPVATMFHPKDKSWNRLSKVTHWKEIILP